MNSVELSNHLIFRAKNLYEFTVTTEVPENFKFNGIVPFNMNIADGILEAKVWAVDFDEAVHRLSEFLETCK